MTREEADNLGLTVLAIFIGVIVLVSWWSSRSYQFKERAGLGFLVVLLVAFLGAMLWGAIAVIHWMWRHS